MKAIIISALLIAFVAYIFRKFSTHRTPRAAFKFSRQQVVDYHKSTASNIKYLDEEFDKSFLIGAQTILDVGCGDGKMPAYIAKKNPESTVMGVDICPTMIEFAKIQYPPNKYPNLTFIEKDARNLEMANAFDRIISFNSLHWITNQKQALQSIYNSLRPGGKAYIVVSPQSFQNHLRVCCRKIILSFKWLPYFLTFKSPHSMLSENQYRQLLNSIGYIIDKITTRQPTMSFKNKAEAEIFLRSILTPLSHLSDQNKIVFMQDLFNEFAKQGAIKSDGSIAFQIDQLDLLVSKPLN
jgi:ubiquinone/menaquinone biosynthesis C-methylase UbiE